MVLVLIPDGVGMVNAFTLLVEMSMRHAEAMAVSLNMISAVGVFFLDCKYMCGLFEAV